MSSSNQVDEDSGSEQEQHYIIYDYDGDLNREWAAEREQERLNTYRNAIQLHPSYVFNKDIDAHLENLDIESRRLQDNIQKIGNIISNLNFGNQYQSISQQKNLAPKQAKPKSKPKPKQQLNIQESIDLQEKILSGS